MEAITNVNLPKFLTQDLVMFKGIISDLFPKIELPNITYEIFENNMISILKNKNLQNNLFMKKKIFQLFEMIKSRHGIMLVGETFSGKTTAFKVYCETLTECSKNNPNEFFPAHVIYL